MPLNTKTLSVIPLGNAVGAEIHGVDLSADILPEQFAEIRAVLEQYGVIFFRDQELTPDQHLAFARRWGTVNRNRFFDTVEGFPDIAEVRKEPHHIQNIGSTWHTDHSYDTVPAFGSVLYGREVPDIGGDTMFAGMAAAYEGLSTGLKQTLQSLRAAHSSRHVFGRGETKIANTDLSSRVGNSELATQDSVHPVVLIHPGTGRKGLYVNPQFTTHIDGWTVEESKPFLQMLYDHAQQPEYVCRFKWGKGSLAVWDNLATWHRAVNDYQGSRRLMHRVTIDGVPI